MAGSESLTSGNGESSGPGPHTTEPDDSAALWGPPGADASSRVTAGGPASHQGLPPAGTNPATPLGRPPLPPPATTSTIGLTRPATQPAPAIESLDGQGQVMEFDLGDRSATQVESGTSNNTIEDASDWAVDLDAPDGWVDEGGRAAPVSPDALRRRRRLFVAAAAVLVLIVGGLSVPSFFRDDEDPEPTGQTVVLGQHLTAPVALNLPEGAVATADDSYIGVQFDDGGWVLVTVPEQVVQPDGTRAPLPADPAAWLQRHPDVYVSGVRQVQVDGRTATQLDYRRSSMAQPQSRYARLPLFCGWRGSGVTEGGLYRASRSMTAGECTQITAGARVRATFIPVDGQIVLVEAIWRPYGVWGWRMPNTLRDSYNELLTGLSPRAAS